jgi:flagellar hook-length control protein FliK
MPTDSEQAILKSAAVEKALDHFLNDFKGVEASSSKIQIVLEPESLGTLTISVSRTENGIPAKIQSEDRKVCAIVSDQIQKLVESMENKGITVEQVDVVFGQTGQDLSFAQNDFGNRQQNSSGYTANAKEETEVSGSSGFFDLWQAPPGGGEEGSGTVEYRV